MGSATVRVPLHLWTELESLLTRRYPEREWASFFRFGWRLVGGHVVVTIASVEAPGDGDLDGSIPIAGILEPYTVRTVLAAEGLPLAIGVIHSHPQGYGTSPSPTDDEMDAYFSSYLASFLPNRPYASLIFSLDEAGHRQLSGRVWVEGQWRPVEKTILVGDGIETIFSRGEGSAPNFAGAAPTVAAYGHAAALTLQNSVVGVVGVGGTGSAVAEILARAGVGHLVLMDHDAFEARNLERLHGSGFEHISLAPLKVDLVRDLCLRINPDMKVTAIHGNCLGTLAMDWLSRCDLVMGSTDTTHGRVGLSELAYRYLVPVIDLGVQLDGHHGKLKAEVIQVAVYAPGAPCAYCLELVDPARLWVELMAPEERERRRAAAAVAEAEGRKPDMYWKDQPQLLTVGHLTTAAAGIGTTYAIGMLTGCSKAPSKYFQCDLLADGFGFVSVNLDSKPSCACSVLIGHADQGASRAVISMPAHWPEPREV